MRHVGRLSRIVWGSFTKSGAACLASHHQLRLVPHPLNLNSSNKITLQLESNEIWYICGKKWLSCRVDLQPINACCFPHNHKAFFNFFIGKLLGVERLETRAEQADWQNANINKVPSCYAGWYLAPSPRLPDRGLEVGTNPLRSSAPCKLHTLRTGTSRSHRGDCHSRLMDVGRRQRVLKVALMLGDKAGFNPESDGQQKHTSEPAQLVEDYRPLYCYQAHRC